MVIITALTACDSIQSLLMFLFGNGIFWGVSDVGQQTTEDGYPKEIGNGYGRGARRERTSNSQCCFENRDS